LQPSSKVLWGEGLFLRPQHFQRQDAYHEWRIAESARSVHPYAWGFRHCRIDTDALANSVFALEDVRAVFPDGEPYNAPAEDEVPGPLNLAELPAHVSETTIYLGLQPMRPQGHNSSAPGESGGLRYVQAQAEAPDWFTRAADAEIVVLRRSARLLTDAQPRDHLTTLPLARVRRHAAGGFELDRDFIAPCLTIQASGRLEALLRRLLDVLRAKVDALYGFHREPARHIIEFRSGDVASFWLLHTASTACARLTHYLSHPGLHPERLYESLLELAGSLMTFSKGHTLGDLPAYRHEAPDTGFLALDRLIRELLETVISTRYFAIALGETKPGHHTARLDSEQINERTQFYVGVSAGMAPAELVDVVPLRFKIGAPDDVEKLVLSALAGVRIEHVPQVPAAIPVRPGNYYFAIEPRGPLYERMLQSRTMTIYAPSGIRELKLELLALNQ